MRVSDTHIFLEKTLENDFNVNFKINIRVRGNKGPRILKIIHLNMINVFSYQELCLLCFSLISYIRNKLWWQ